MGFPLKNNVILIFFKKVSKQPFWVFLAFFEIFQNFFDEKLKKLKKSLKRQKGPVDDFLKKVKKS